MATAVINGIVVTGSVEEIHQLIQRTTTTVTTEASTVNQMQLEGRKNAYGRQTITKGV
jgi:hypothetical protein